MAPLGFLTMCVRLDLCLCESLVNEPDRVWEISQSESGSAVILVRSIMDDGGWRNNERCGGKKKWECDIDLNLNE